MANWEPIGINKKNKLLADKERLDWLSYQMMQVEWQKLADGIEYLIAEGVTVRGALDEFMRIHPCPCCLRRDVDYREACTRCDRPLCDSCVEYYALESGPGESWPYCAECLPVSEVEAIKLAEALIEELSKEGAASEETGG